MERTNYSIKIVISYFGNWVRQEEREKGVTRELLILINKNVWHLLWLAGGYDLISLLLLLFLVI